MGTTFFFLYQIFDFVKLYVIVMLEDTILDGVCVKLYVTVMLEDAILDGVCVKLYVIVML